MSKSVKIQKRKNKENSNINMKDLAWWALMTLLLAISMGILYGTVEYYLNTTELLYGLYMSWEQFFLVLGFGLWAIFTFIIFKC